MPGSISRIALLFTVYVSMSLLLSGCETLGYYSQGIKGHVQLVSQVEPIDEVISRKSTPSKTRKLLKKAKLARAFAIDNLQLPDSQSYLGYADLKRKNVTWNVVATRPLSMLPYQSCFPVVGCISYRGYFKESAAKQFARQLQRRGYETSISGSTAYSTLGWFEDPIVNPMLENGEIGLIETLFHELAHQQLYIKNDSNFNEAFATTVGQNGVREWLRETRPDFLPRYNRYLLRQRDFLKLLRNAAEQLKTLYKTGLSSTQKLLNKKRVINQLRQDYSIYKQRHKGYKAYDQWFKKPINNPRLAMVSVYHELVPDFERWLISCNNSYPSFYKTVRWISAMPKEQRITILKQPAHCVK